MKSNQPTTMSVFSTTLIAFAALAGSGLGAAEIVIVNAGNGLASIPKDDLQAIYEGKKANWEDGGKIQVVTVPSAPVHEEFLKDNVGKTPSQFATAWKKLVFTGKAKAPTECKTEADVIAFVAANKDAIGYVSDGAALPGVKKVPVN